MIFRVAKQYLYCGTGSKHEEKQTINSFSDMGWFNFFAKPDISSGSKLKNFAKPDISSN